jgi:hypothetical protein
MKKALSQMTDGEIKAAVANCYGEVATHPAGKFNFPVGREFAESVGYSSQLLDKTPPSLWGSFTGAGNPKVLWSGRNTRCGHKLALCDVIRAEKK